MWLPFEVPPPQGHLTGALLPPSTLHYAGTPEKFQRASVGAQHAAPHLGAMSNPTGFLECGSLPVCRRRATAFTPATPPRRTRGPFLPDALHPRQFGDSRQQLARSSPAAATRPKAGAEIVALAPPARALRPARALCARGYESPDRRGSLHAPGYFLRFARQCASPD